MNTLDTTIDSLCTQLHQVQLNQNVIGDSQYDHSFDRTVHWAKLVLASQTVSKECTKLAVAYSKEPEPSPENSEVLIKNVATAMDILLAWAKTVPLSEGRFLRKKLMKAFDVIIDGVKDLLLSVKEQRCTDDQRRLTATGTVWKACEEIEKIPRDNRSAVLEELEESLSMVSDALVEIESEVQETSWDDNDDEESWCAQDRPVIIAGIGLIKVCKSCLKKSKTLLSQYKGTESTTETKELDQLGIIMGAISPCVDDFQLSLYPRLSSNNIQLQVEPLVKNITNIIDLVRTCYFIKTTDTSWIDFLSSALQHNHSKLLNALVNVDGN